MIGGLIVGGFYGMWFSIPKEKRAGTAFDFWLTGFAGRKYLRYYAIPVITYGGILFGVWFMPKDYEYEPDPIGLLVALAILGLGTGLFMLDYYLR